MKWKYGLSFNLKMLKENNPELWKKYEPYFKDANFDDEEQVFIHELPNGKKALELMRELIPDELKKEFEKGI
ncbi:hypothetical protein [Neobacillus niacini]|uniref:hypothetical protein n=1 Tax=Neobacillus niacini TaxID=86668 RepID=UPI00285B213B|nr:hypothetical protein [Neobacillus niacini]MDR7000081.1 uncharacterized protein with ATP-grasp and redox domains [Neobacillus niacini]